jgi:hypothetical protein
LAALEWSISSLIKGPPKKQCKNINTIQNEKHQTHWMPLYRTCKKQNKGKTNNNTPFLSPPSIAENLVLFYFGWLTILSSIKLRFHTFSFPPHMVYNKNQPFDFLDNHDSIYHSHGYQLW